ncbi:hypothetical protein SteCoe_3907 [Stentor coeruleus]|uniref:Uncharacterized protein n=1 Tax=Stentor coeruleus TaxID=5963 RepID=A0A1R2CW20_9CILI|nr:hypothetical protein SteCoe_3907 [Stentor coeruleus]
MEIQQKYVIELFQHTRLSEFFDLKIQLIDHNYKFFGALSFSIFLHINDLHESRNQFKAEKLVEYFKGLLSSIVNESILHYIEYYNKMLDFCAVGNLDLNELRINKGRLELCGLCLFLVGIAKVSQQFNPLFNIKNNRYHLEMFARCLKVTIMIINEDENQCELLGCDKKSLILPIIINGPIFSVLKCMNKYRGHKKFPVLYMAKGNISSALNSLGKFFKKNPTLEQKNLLREKLNQLKEFPEINLFLSQEIHDISDGLNNIICEHKKLKFIRTECKESHCLECLINHLKKKFPKVLETCYNEDMACNCMKKISLKDHREICDIYKSMQSSNQKKMYLNKEVNVDVYIKSAKNFQFEIDREKEIQRNTENERKKVLEEERLRQIEEQRRYDFEIKQKIEDENKRREEERLRQIEEQRRYDLEIKQKIEDENRRREEENERIKKEIYSKKIQEANEKFKEEKLGLKRKYNENLKSIHNEFIPYKEKSPSEYQDDFILLDSDSPQFNQSSPRSPIYINPEPMPKNTNKHTDINNCSEINSINKIPEFSFKPTYIGHKSSPQKNQQISFGINQMKIKCDKCKEVKFKQEFTIECRSEIDHNVCNSCNSGRINCIICNTNFTEDQLEIFRNYANFNQKINKTCERCKRVINDFQIGSNRNLCQLCEENSILCFKCTKSLTQERSFKCKHCKKSMHYTCNNSSDICSICKNSL